MPVALCGQVNMQPWTRKRERIAQWRSRRIVPPRNRRSA
jgi:hypothetical protein